VGGVLDRQNVMLTRDRKQVVEIARLAGEIHREDRSVRLVIRGATSAGSSINVSDRISAKIGTPP